jgi:Ser/Thr protein kinase RdoA (MazF antagonist)
MTDRTAQAGMIELDGDDLALTVAALLAPALGRPVRVDALRREPSPFATLFPAEVLRASLDGNTEVRLFLKHLGPEQPGQPDKQLRDRELRVYDVLLRDPNLPVPRHYGARWNAVTGRHELFLEYVDDWSLKYHSLEHWVSAAHRLAHLHAHFAERADLLRSCDFLLRLDVPYFAAWAARACSAVGEQSSELAARLRETLKDYNRCCELLGRQPLTLVHNDLAPKNVLADRSVTPARICFVDWELAGAGCGLLDLVHLKYGLDAVGEGEMMTAYRSALRSTDLLPRDEREFERLLAACELHKTLYRLAHSAGWNLPPATIAQWVEEAAAFLRCI